jgi:hypothetical protein
MQRFPVGTRRSQPHTVRRLRVGRASGSRQAPRTCLWYLTIAGIPAPRRKPAPGCVIHKTKPKGPDAGQHGKLPGEILQPKWLSQGEQWRRRPNTSVRAFSCPTLGRESHKRWSRSSRPYRELPRDFGLGQKQSAILERPTSGGAAVSGIANCRAVSGRARNCQAMLGKAQHCRQALKCRIWQA